MAAKQDERKFILECIDVYRKLPALWKVNSREYRDRHKKNVAYQTLQAKYRERYPEATREDVSKKINSLRTNFRKELKKVQASTRSGGGKDDIYESSLWYFDAMIFLQETGSSYLAMATEPEIGEDGQLGMEFVHTAPSTSISDTNTSPPKRKTQNTDREDERDELLYLACNRPNQHDNEHLQLTKVWAIELSKMSPNQQLFAKKAINDILFEGQMGTLHRHSVEINSSASIPTTPYNTRSNSSYLLPMSNEHVFLNRTMNYDTKQESHSDVEN